MTSGANDRRLDAAGADWPPPLFRPERLYAWYFGVQAVVGIGLWVAFAGSTTVRSWFDLVPSNHAVTDAFFLADLLVGVLGSGLSAWALETGATWTLPIVAFTAGGMVYPTLYLVAWVAITGTHAGRTCLVIMIPPSTITCWITYQLYRTSRAARR
jgi:hypothetical protein